ncbi:hypothetical protein [Acidovorax sp. LjRoot194]|uniref:hypothetical protein n=1 Tax=Acidovorax sp. LjRoot194 TaxID=3342280 RepID=UPI003F4FEB16
MPKLLEIDRTRADRLSAIRSVDLTPKWEAGVVSRVKAVRMAALTGAARYVDPWLDLPQACGVIELTGNREGVHRMALIIGFSEDPSLVKEYSFAVGDADAVGTMVLPAPLFSQYLQISQLANAHFRIGGNGSINGLASEPTIFQLLK